jgi:uncharacterized protein YqjF (DUF2071 family)
VIVRHALMFQEWRHITFLHWRVPAEQIESRIPKPLVLDLFDGSAWVGVTPFLLCGLRPPFGPRIAWLSQFPETNCRTYVRGPDGVRGVWFFSLEAARLPAVMGARAGFGLPYAWARMRVQTGPRVRYASSRLWPNRAATTRIEVEPGAPIAPGDREVFLTARFRLYSLRMNRLVYADVEHAPWPLQSAHVIGMEQTLTRACGLPDFAEPPLTFYSEGVKVRVGFPRRTG